MTNSLNSLAPAWALVLGLIAAGLIVFGIVGLVSGGKKGMGVTASVIALVGGAILGSMAAMGPSTTINLFQTMGKTALNAITTIINSLLVMLSKAFG
ncbi:MULTISPECIES: hypothetical protein [Lactococcus]|uniref:Uncharacterized protein n=2 Tax=Lactococcus TaxID=1357 RepID=A0AB35KFP2_9LACT|nr:MULTISPECIES: hypothetical protein [Lactococcus]ARE27169.1 hypothetical protein LLJM1_04125 [Lactococcus cremoris]KZK47830.1 hypothetical protein FG2_1123 [Lactococcus cremoris]MDG5049956.1 hypothetical protein [Lactococcus lactis]PAL03011.1 hypothetical protein B8W91_08770 [Lactococcus lactis]